MGLFDSNPLTGLIPAYGKLIESLPNLTVDWENWTLHIANDNPTQKSLTMMLASTVAFTSASGATSCVELHMLLLQKMIWILHERV